MRTSTAFILLLCVCALSARVHAQGCTIQDNYDYDATGNSVTLYGITSAAACCTACAGFEDCQYWSWVKDSTQSTYQQCVIKNKNSKQVSSTTTTAGVISRAQPAGTTCSNIENNVDYDNGFISVAYGVTNSSACCANCNGYAGCNYWVYTGDKSCYLKGSNSGRKNSSGLVAGSTLTPRTVALRTGKRGVGWFNSNSCSDMKKLNSVAWTYNWGPQPDNYLMQCINNLGFEYIPMQWGLPLQLNNIYTNSKYLLTFNEPNFASQSNLTPQQAAAAWPQIQSFAAQYGMQISSPAAAAGGNPDPVTWLDQFFGNCTGCKVDFITTHIYTCSAVGVKNYLATFKKYNKPIWLTEFSCPSAGGSPPTAFMNETLGYLDADPQFARYAWFGTRIAPSDTWLGSQVNVFSSTASALSPLGQVYSK